MDDNKNMPVLPGQPPDLLAERKWWGTPTDGILLDFAEPYRAPRFTLEHNGTPFAKLGDLHIVGGKSGHGKTAFMSQIMAAILSGRFGGLSFRLRDLGKSPTVLYVDTEQSKDDTIALKNRVCAMAGIPYDKPNERFKVAMLRETISTEERYRQILQLNWDMKPTVIFIDGLLDLVNDYNEQKECSDLIRELMKVSTAMNQSMWCVLHENPMTDKLVGSLGSIAERKVTEVFIVRKHKAPHNEKRFADMPRVFFEIKQSKARGKDQEDWYFTVEDKGFGWGMPVEFGYGDPATTHRIEEVEAWIIKRYRDIEWPATRKDIYEKIFEPEGVTDHDEQIALIDMALNRRFFILQTKEELATGQRSPKLKLGDVKPF